ncbi:hypothetical protein [Vibrio gazogenes]|uniref:Uncharacterized protein n=1 Tax=Vibrio gazogenes TaxID=687 RepID=A0A1Z2SH85_VIBGA|nr:hypothetical protein [Vibrio gazogenes]ASA56532.1 hypothetical protein BSQ33_13085 [Vibrio gazogenes]
MYCAPHTNRMMAEARCQIVAAPVCWGSHLQDQGYPKPLLPKTAASPKSAAPLHRQQHTQSKSANVSVPVSAQEKT